MKKKVIKFRREREGKTNYRKRLKLLKSRKPRLVIRKTNKNSIVQVIKFDFDGDRVLACASSKEIKKLGWEFSRKNIPAMYLTGLLCGVRAKKKGIKEAIVDIRHSVKKSGVYAAVKGASVNLKIPCNSDVFPSDERIRGAHIINYFNMLKEKGKQFSRYKNVESFSKEFENIKNKILENGKE